MPAALVFLAVAYSRPLPTRDRCPLRSRGVLSTIFRLFVLTPRHGAPSRDNLKSFSAGAFRTFRYFDCKILVGPPESDNLPRLVLARL